MCFESPAQSALDEMEPDEALPSHLIKIEPLPDDAPPDADDEMSNEGHVDLFEGGLEGYG